MKRIITAGKYKGMEYEGRFYQFENCIVTEEPSEDGSRIVIQHEDGTLSGVMRKKSTLEETLHDWLYCMRKNGFQEEQIQLAVEKAKKFFKSEKDSPGK